MPTNWTIADTAKLNGFDAAAFWEWLRTGLRDWDIDELRWQAFAPVVYRFDPFDDPEDSIARMFEALSEDRQSVFCEALAFGFSAANITPEAFDFLQNILVLLKRSEPVEAMVARLCESNYLDATSHEVADQLFARVFAVEALYTHPRWEALYARLKASSYFRETYRPRIEERIAAAQQR